MLDAAGPVPDLDLILSPEDSAEFLGVAEWRRRDGRVETSQLWLVLHRRHGLWTHAYRVVPDRRPGHLAVYLERAVEGDARVALRGWLRGCVAG